VDNKIKFVTLFFIFEHTLIYLLYVIFVLKVWEEEKGSLKDVIFFISIV